MGNLSAGKRLVLKNHFGSSNCLKTIYTGEKQSRSKEEIRCEIANWMQNEHFEKLRENSLDLAMVIYLNKTNYERQDVDNISKTVLDALQKPKNEKDNRWLFRDDNQVIRLLLYKLPRKEIDGENTNELIISFREHDEKKQMILEESPVLI